jgi:NTP pyrophosphatase (non-canonical NTP hydrolase)
MNTPPEKLEKAIQDLFKETPQRDPYKRFTILAYQVAEVGKSMRYGLIYKDKTEAYKSYLKTGLSDLLIQTIIFAKLFNYDVQELLDLGIERLQEYRSKGDYQEK